MIIKNGDGLDNREFNLRPANYSENGANRKIRSDNTSGFKGVYWLKKNRKWQAQIRVHGKPKHLGLFSSKIDAAKAYNDAAIKEFGDFALINKIDIN